LDRGYVHLSILLSSLLTLSPLLSSTLNPRYPQPSTLGILNPQPLQTQSKPVPRSTCRCAVPSTIPLQSSVDQSSGEPDTIDKTRQDKTGHPWPCSWQLSSVSRLVARNGLACKQSPNDLTNQTQHLSLRTYPPQKNCFRS
jgi:hypothetical protein